MNNIKFNSVLIVGVGLIGSSLARAIRDNNLAKNIYGLPMAKNINGPPMAKNIKSEVASILVLACHYHR